MVFLYVIFGFIQICLISNLIFKCSTKQSAAAARRAPGSSARSSNSIQLMKSRSKSNPAPKASKNNNNKKKNIRSIPSTPKSVDVGGGSSAAAGGTDECKNGQERAEYEEDRRRKMIKPQPSPPMKPIPRKIASTPDEDYGEVKEPTESAKIRREKQLEKEKQEKIEKGFYQPNSDEDDTLEPIQSLKEERTENSTKKSIKKKPQQIEK